MAMSNFRYYAPAKSKFNSGTLGSKVNISVLAENLSYAVMLHLWHSAFIDERWILRNCSYCAYYREHELECTQKIGPRTYGRSNRSCLRMQPFEKRSTSPVSGWQKVRTMIWSQGAIKRTLVFLYVQTAYGSKSVWNSDRADLHQNLQCLAFDWKRRCLPSSSTFDTSRFHVSTY